MIPADDSIDEPLRPPAAPFDYAIAASAPRSFADDDDASILHFLASPRRAASHFFDGASAQSLRRPLYRGRQMKRANGGHVPERGRRLDRTVNKANLESGIMGRVEHGLGACSAPTTISALSGARHSNGIVNRAV